MKKGVIYILFALLVVSNLNAQDITISASFDSTRILIGDQVNFTVTVEQPQDIRIKFPSFRDTLVKNIEILSGPFVDSSRIGGGRIRITEKYLVTSFDSGFYKITPLFVEVKDTGGFKRFYSDYAGLEVVKYRVAPADTTAKIYDIIEPYRAPLTAREIISWALAVLVAAALVWGAIIFIRQFKKEKTGVVAIENPDPAHIIAFREMEKLKSEELWQKGHFKQYYTRLTEILRQYLENRYKVYSLELTTSETLDALLATGFEKNGEYDRLKTVLTASDLVKFAKYIPAGEENELHFKNSWEFIDATKEVIIIREQADGPVKEQEENV